MNKLLQTTMSLFVLAGLLTGCVSNPSYQQNHSRAYNIARAGGLVTGIKDQEVPKESYNVFTDSGATDVAYVLAGYSAPVGVFSNWQTGALNLLSSLLEPDKHGARNSMLAWMPANMASSPKDAQEKMFSHVKISVEKALSSLGAEYALMYSKDGVFVYHFYNPEWDCQTWVLGKSKSSEMCSVHIAIFGPRKIVGPDYIYSGEAYAFEAGHGYKYNKIEVRSGLSKKMPQQIIYARISENLPEWSFLYLAPNKVALETGEKVKFPYMLNKGKPEFFVYPAD